MAKTMEQFITSQILKTGFPLEIFVKSLLAKYCFVENNEYYFDSDENKAREIDVVGGIMNKFKYEEKIHPFRFNNHIVIECKKSEDTAWVFFTTPSNYVSFEGNFLGYDQRLTKNLRYTLLEELVNEYKLDIRHTRFNRISSTHMEINLSGKNDKFTREILDAKYQLAKYISYDINLTLERIRKDENLRTILDYRVNYLTLLYHPVIVYDGKLYEAIVDDNNVNLKETNHILLNFNYSPSYMSQFINTEVDHLSYTIDVIKKEYLNDFIKIVFDDIQNIYNIIYENYDDLKKEALDDIVLFSKKKKIS